MKRTRFYSFFSISLLVMALFLVSCSDSATDPDDDDNAGDDTETEEITGDYYVQATMDGKVRTVQEKESFTDPVSIGFSSHEGSASNGNDYLVRHATFFSRVIPTGSIPVIDTTNTFFFIFIKHFDDNPYYAEDYAPIIRKGNMSFGSIAKETDGIEIRWTDADGKSWSTAYGSGNQDNSDITITEKVTIEYPSNLIGSRPLFRIQGTFNCRLYDGSGNSIDVTNGKFSLLAIYT